MAADERRKKEECANNHRANRAHEDRSCGNVLRPLDGAIASRMHAIRQLFQSGIAKLGGKDHADRQRQKRPLIGTEADRNPDEDNEQGHQRMETNGMIESRGFPEAAERIEDTVVDHGET